MKKIIKYKKIIITILGIIVILVGYNIYRTYKAANPVGVFEVIELKKKNISKSISVDGVVVADYEISLASEVPGIISKIYVKEGDLVKKGQLLMKLKDTDYRSEVNSAYANQKINEASYEKVKNPNHNLELDKKIIEDSRESVLLNIKKTKSDIQSQIDTLEVNLSQILRMEIDDYFDHTEFDDGYNANPSFTYRLKSSIEIEKLEKERKELGLDFKKYQDSQKTLENSIEIIDKFDKIIFNLYKNSQDFLGFSDGELELKEKYLSSLRAKVLDYRNSLIALDTQLETLQKQLDSNFESEKKIENEVNPADLKLAEEQILQARIKTSNAYTQLQKTYIKAPKSGIVAKIFKETGEYTAPANPLLIINSEEKYLIADIPEVDLDKIKLETQVSIIFDAFPNQTILGKVEFIYPTAKDIQGVTYYEAKISLQNSDEKMIILSGMSAEIFITYAKKNNVLAVKRGVAKKDGEKYYVEVLNPIKELPKDNKFIKKYFEAGFIGDNFIEVIGDELLNFKIIEKKQNDIKQKK